MLPETEFLETSTISDQVNRMVKTMLISYEVRNDFSVESKVKADRVWISILHHGVPNPHIPRLRIIETNKEGTVLNMWDHNQIIFYNYNPGTHSIYMNVNLDGYGFECTIDSYNKKLIERSSVDGYTNLTVTYTLSLNVGGIQGFQSNSVFYEECFKLPGYDISKFLLKYRFITLIDLLVTVVDPCGSSKKIPPIHQTDSFIPLSDFTLPISGGTDSHPINVVSVADLTHDIYGFAHRLKVEPNTWLAFVRFGEEKSCIARALIMEIDFNSIKIEIIQETPIIRCIVLIDNKPYKVSIFNSDQPMFNLFRSNTEAIIKIVKRGKQLPVIFSRALLEFFSEV